MTELRPVEVKLVSSAQPAVVPVLSSELCTRGASASFVRHIVLDLSGTPIAGRFAAGQALGVHPPGCDRHGRPLAVRLYSIASPARGEDGEGRHAALLVKRVIDEHAARRGAGEGREHHLFLGVCSNFLCDRSPGDTIQVTGPRGRRFVLPPIPSEHGYLLVSTGTGIAPLRGFVLELLADASFDRQVVLVSGAPYTTDLLYDELFDHLAANDRRLTYIKAISREAGHRRVDAAIGDALGDLRKLLRASDTLIYVCGLRNMQTGLLKLLRAEGLDDGYLEIDEDYCKTPVDQWRDEEIIHHVQPGPRLLVQVY